MSEPVAPQALSSVDVTRITGATYRQLDHWTRRGYLRPAEPTPGTGVPRSWPPQEVEVARVMARLVTAGVVPDRAAAVAREHVARGGGDQVVIEVSLAG